MLQDLTQRIKQIMAEKHLSPTKIAGELGINYTTLWRRLNGEREINIDFLVKLADILGTSVAFLLGETDDPYLDLSSVTAVENNGSGPARVSKVTLDLEKIIKDLVYEHPDLAIGFRDTRECWSTLSENDKESIADALMLAFGPEGYVPRRLRREGRYGTV